MALQINGLNTSQTTTKQTKGNEAVADAKADASSKTATSGSPTVSISDEAKSLHQLQGEVSKGSAVNESRVAEIKAALADGSFQPDANRTASKMLNMDDQF